MAAITQEVIDSTVKAQSDNTIRNDNPDLKQLLDVIVSILADEYIKTVRKNPTEFSTQGEPS